MAPREEDISHPHHHVLEPLALNYLTFGFQTLANNLWAWITLLTAAAFTFWETTASPPQEDDIHPPADDCHEQSSHASPHAALTTSSSDIPTSADVSTGGSSTRGKFTAYFHVIEQDHDQDDIDGFEEGDVMQLDSSINIIGKQSGRAADQEYLWWEAEMRMRMDLNMSWYSLQDLRVIDGNVVKVWEEIRR